MITVFASNERVVADSDLILFFAPEPPRGALEPVVVHSSQELIRDRKARCRTHHSVNRALRTERGLTIVNPLADRCRRERGQTIKASADRTGLDFCPVKAAMLMRLDVRRIKAVWIQADHRSQVQSIAEDGRTQWGDGFGVPSCRHQD